VRPHSTRGRLRLPVPGAAAATAGVGDPCESGNRSGVAWATVRIRRRGDASCEREQETHADGAGGRFDGPLADPRTAVGEVGRGECGHESDGIASQFGDSERELFCDAVDQAAIGELNDKAGRYGSAARDVCGLEERGERRTDSARESFVRQTAAETRFV
jgi:hypothetical protein